MILILLILRYMVNGNLEVHGDPLCSAPLHATKVAAGTDIVKKSLESFAVPSVSTTILLDGAAYDAFPALATLEDSWTLKNQ